MIGEGYRLSLCCSAPIARSSDLAAGRASSTSPLMDGPGADERSGTSMASRRGALISCRSRNPPSGQVLVPARFGAEGQSATSAPRLLELPKGAVKRAPHRSGTSRRSNPTIIRNLTRIAGATTTTELSFTQSTQWRPVRQRCATATFTCGKLGQIEYGGS